MAGSKSSGGSGWGLLAWPIHWALTDSGRWATWMEGPLAKTMARWMTFSSSRTLPGQEWAWRHSRASAETWEGPPGFFARCLVRKYWTKAGMSPFRLLRVGRWRLTTLRR